MKKYNGTEWVDTTLRQYKTATDTLTTLPVDVYADGNNATVSLKGNTVQNGTPTPDNPIMPEGTGERTGNLFDYVEYFNSTFISYNEFFEYSVIQLNPNTTYTLSTSLEERDTGVRNTAFIVATTNKPPTTVSGGISNISPITITTESDGILKLYKRISGAGIHPTKDLFDDGDWLMLNTGSTPLPYEPYGYKIPISSANTTTPVYLGEVATTRRIKKLVLTGEELWNVHQNTYYITVSGYYRLHDVGHHLSVCSHFPIKQEIILPEMYYGLGGLIDEKTHTTWNGNIVFNPSPMISSLTDWKSYLAAQYAAGTPVCVWYVLAEPETGIANEPLMKIGNYADTVSGITVPTITGKDTFDIDTTLKPSEVSLSYTGWHDATVEEWDGSQWNE